MDTKVRRRLKFEIVKTDGKSSFAFIDDRPGHYRFEWHYHPEIELTWIAKGRGLRFVGDSIEPFQEGDLCLIGSHTPHTWRSEPVRGRPVRALVIQIPPGILDPGLLALPEMRSVRLLLERSRHGLQFKGGISGVVPGLMERVGRRRPGSPERLVDLLSILTRLARHQGRTLSGSLLHPLDDRRADRRLNAVCELVHKRLPEALSQTQVARAAGLSPAAFSRFFKRCMGRTFVAYVNELRIGRACRSLLETQDGIAEIAFACGFNNLSNFNRQFFRLKGKSPRDFRKLSAQPG